MAGSARLSSACVFGAWAILAIATTARAVPLDPDADVARHRFELGAAAYGAGDYATALSQFEVVRSLHPSPQIEYNIGRCLDRLERWREAIESYERFLAAAPEDLEANEVRARLAVLHERLDRARRTTRKSMVRAAFGLLGGALALGLGGAAYYGVTYDDYAVNRDLCARTCAPDSYDDLRDRVRAGQIGSGVLFGLAGVALVTDVTLWILAHRRPGGAVHAASASAFEVRF